MSREKGAQPPRPRQSEKQLRLAADYAPLIYFDEREPFLPLAVGYTVFAADGDSPSFPRRIELAAGRNARLAIEYAIWWDWDIGHLYELEHTWTYVGADGEVVFAEASWHGGYHAAVLDDGRVPVIARESGRHPVVYSEPGKHAFAPTPQEILDKRRDKTLDGCGPGAGRGGLLVTPLFRGILDLRKNAEADALVGAYLKRHAFVPAFDWNREFRVSREMLLPWPALFRWIPTRLDWWLEQLRSGAE